MWFRRFFFTCAVIVLMLHGFIAYWLFSGYRRSECPSNPIYVPSSIESAVIDLQKFLFNPLTKAYEIDGKPILWLYWHDWSYVPLYARLMIEALQCRNPEFQSIVVTKSTIRHYLPNFNISWKLFSGLSGNHQADIFRVHIMFEYGGAYADVDTFALDKLHPWYQQLESYDFVTPNWDKEITTMGVFGPVRAHSSLFQIWSLHQEKVIQEKKCCRWGAFGPTPLNAQFMGEIANNRTRILHYDGYETVGQLVQRELDLNATAQFADVEWKFMPLKSAPFIIIHHTPMKKLFWNVSDVEELLPQNTTLFSAFVGCALLDCMPKYNATIRIGRSHPELSWVVAEDIKPVLNRIDREVCENLKRRR